MTWGLVRKLEFGKRELGQMIFFNLEKWRQINGSKSQRNLIVHQLGLVLAGPIGAQTEGYGGRFQQ